MNGPGTAGTATQQGGGHLSTGGYQRGGQGREGRRARLSQAEFVAPGDDSNLLGAHSTKGHNFHL